MNRSKAARAMGQAKTPAKAAAARENGKKGGRPPKDDRYEHVTCSKCGERYQKIDYAGALHQLTCGYPVPEPLAK